MGSIRAGLRNRIAEILIVGGMGLYSLSIPLFAYLHYIQPPKPQMALEYRYLCQEFDFLESAKQFSLEEALDSIHMEHYAEEVKTLSARINEIRASEGFAAIPQYEREIQRHNIYWFLPVFSMILGIVSMLYGVHLDSKINSRPSEN